MPTKLFIQFVSIIIRYLMIMTMDRVSRIYNRFTLATKVYKHLKNVAHNDEVYLGAQLLTLSDSLKNLSKPIRVQKQRKFALDI